MVQLVECIGSTLSPLQTIYLRLMDADANVATVSDRVQEELDSEEPIVMLDSRGMEPVHKVGREGYCTIENFVTGVSHVCIFLNYCR